MTSYKRKSLAEQVAELDDPAPRDYDPEDVDFYKSSEDESGPEDKPDGREHYQTVGKSKLRKPEVAPLGPAYHGSRVSRSAVEDSEDDGYHTQSDVEENEEEESLAELDMEDDKMNMLEDSRDEESEEELDGDLEMDEEEEDDQFDDDDDDDNDDDTEESFNEDDDLRDPKFSTKEPMSEQFQKMDLRTVTKTLSEAVAKDVEKGNAIRSQRAAFDSLLNVRIRLQKALISINSIPEAKRDDSQTLEPGRAADNALEAAVQLVNVMSSIRHSLNQSKDSTGSKRKYKDISSSTSLSDIWIQLKEQERDCKKSRNSTLNFWSTKLRPQQGEKRLTGTNQQSLTEVLSGQLTSDMSRLVERTQMPRSCAPLQAKLGSKPSQEASALPIYDDADFYGLLLQSLITQRGSDAAAQSALNVNFPAQPWQAARDAKFKKNVDTKASKGRRLRYTVHEKIQDLMPREDRTTWTERQSDELFASILGRKIELQDVESEEEDGTDLKEFRLF